MLCGRNLDKAHKHALAHRVAMREHVPIFGHDLGTDAANESTKVLIFLMYGNCLYCDAIRCCWDERVRIGLPLGTWRA